MTSDPCIFKIPSTAATQRPNYFGEQREVAERQVCQGVREAETVLLLLLQENSDIATAALSEVFDCTSYKSTKATKSYNTIDQFVKQENMVSTLTSN